MLVSTKAGTVVKLVSRGQRTAAQARPSSESLKGGSLRSLVGHPVWDEALKGHVRSFCLRLRRAVSKDWPHPIGSDGTCTIRNGLAVIEPGDAVPFLDVMPPPDRCRDSWSNLCG
jgi:hypothetical protein